MSDKYKNIAMMLGAFFIFSLSFQVNFFNAASRVFFEGHQRDSEALVLGRLVETQNNGYLSSGGFLGRYENKDWVNSQYEIYKNNKPPESSFRTYTSSFGLQGYFYATFDSFLRSTGIQSGDTRLHLSKLITSSLLAGLLVLFIYFVIQNFGLLAATITTVLLASSQWVVVFSNNLYWMFFLIILPFIVTITFYQFNIQHQNHFLKKRVNLLYVLIFFAVLIKSLSGYEYISTILISTVTPLIFFAIRDNWGFKQFAVRFVLVGLSGLTGFFAAIFLHFMQLAYVFGSYTEGLAKLWITIAKRTHGDPNTVHEVYRASLESNVLDVIWKYWNGHAFNLDSLIGFGGLITFGALILTLLTLSSAITILTLSSKNFKKIKKLNLAAVSTLWFSVLAPLSWHSLAKGHSYIHIHMNHVLWYVPFLLIGFAYIGYIISLSISNLISSSLKTRIIALGCLPALLTAINLTEVYKENNAYSSYINNPDITINLNLERGLSVFFSKNTIAFVAENCDQELSTRFFLHLIPYEASDLPENRKKHKFDNLDFNWKNKETHSFTQYLFGQKSCIASIQLPSYPIKGIRTGQFNQGGQLWKKYIDLTGKHIISELQAFNLTDRNWANGASRSRSGFFTENTFAIRQSIKPGDTLIFNESGQRVIEEVSYSSRYINIFISGNKLSSELDGYPNRIKIIQDSSVEWGINE